MGYTENMSSTYLSSGNPCLDFFYHVVPDTPPETLTRRLVESWDHDPLITLKLICNLRGVRGTGKMDKEGFYTSALWLHRNHPKTLACNVASMAAFGYFKDLPELLYRLLKGSDARKKENEQRPKKTSFRFFRQQRGRQSKAQKAAVVKMKQKERKIVPREERISAEKKRMEAVKEFANKIRHEKKYTMAKKAVDRYKRDPDYRFLYDRVSDHFAECLRSDIKFLEEGKVRKISLAAKWCPSLNQSFDRSTLLCESIAKKVFPRGEYAEYDGVEEGHYTYRVRDRLRKEILVPLRKALELPEVYIGKNEWGLIPYNRVASVAMTLYKDKFLKHDETRFQEYLENAKSGKATIASGALLPHEIISRLRGYDGGLVAELQWKRMVDDMAKIGKFNNCLAICDVSGSMIGQPMDVCGALGILVSELSKEPWKGKVITFSQNPTLQMVKGKNLKSKTQFMRKMEWGMNTNFQKVFDLILEVASIKGRLRKKDMIKRVFVFSDMEFDQASKKPWETDYKVIKRKFEEKGYEVPDMVFWNLRDSRATPVLGKENGVALVSGFSKNLMKLFMKNGGVINPEIVLESVISGEEYSKLVVVD
ncbi:uncharacterized protein [Rutidosis leptorrhynchoides]|uniref:uncharacterized protein n=1 Tax=Rutidosis leptorrhynchoides TaxID=125765 RepID=UPI003A996EF0